MFFPMMDPIYMLFMLPVMLFAMWAQWQVQANYRKYAEVANMKRLTGLDVAKVLMQNEGLNHVTVDRVDGHLTDHYDPRGKVMRLSQDSFATPSVASMAIVAHELGHAAQDKEGYFWLRARSGIVAFANIGSNLGVWLIFGGMALLAMNGGRGGMGLSIAWLGVLLFAGAVAFTLVTLPVEFNASSRAKEMLMRNGLVSNEEADGVNKVLGAAALTYVASAAQSIAQLLYFVTLLSGRSNRD